MSATFCLVAPIGAGNWPAAAALVNLSQTERAAYTFRLNLMKWVEGVNLSLPGYQGPTNLGGNRWRQLLTLYNQQWATIGRRRPARTYLSLQSLWCHARREMLELIDRNSGLGVPVLPPAPGPVVGHQQQHLSLQQQPQQRTPLPASRPNSATEAIDNVGEEEEADDEMEGMEEEDDGGEEADTRLMGFFGFGGY